MSKMNKHAQSLGKRTWTGDNKGQASYDYDDVKAHPTRIGTSFSQDCWRENLYEKYEVEDAD